MIGVWVQLLRVPYRWLYPAILAFCCIGVYSINNNVFDVWMTIGFGALGYLFNKLGCESAPLILGFILGPMMEENMRRALLLSRGDMSCFSCSPRPCARAARRPSGRASFGRDMNEHDEPEARGPAE